MFETGDRVRLTDVVAYQCGDGCCQWEYDVGELATVVKTESRGSCVIAVDKYDYFPVSVFIEQIEKITDEL